MVAKNELSGGFFNCFPEKYGTQQFFRFWDEKKKCCRCGVVFSLTKSGEQTAFPSTCVYHWDNNSRLEHYKCCGKKVEETPGCKQEYYHVYQHKVFGVEALPSPIHGFVSTPKSKIGNRGKASRDVVALDCEMVYTVSGMKLAQVVVVDVKGLLKYGTYVNPHEKILSYNTEHSGVRKADLEGPGVKRLEQVQEELCRVISDRTIIIGHALHNDLKVLKLLHNIVIDTKLLYQAHTGIRSLKELASVFLNIDIRNSPQNGHDCVLDARAALDLALRFVGERKRASDSKENLKTM